jgi:hypothetical protein
MATTFKNALIPGLGTTETTVFTTASNARTTVIGLSFTNMTQSTILASVRIADTVAGTSAYYLRDIIIPPNQSLRAINGGERLVLGPSSQLKVQANTDDSLDCVISYVEIV